MLYDMKMHLPQLIDKMMVEDYRAGDVTKLENDKTLLIKLLSEHDGFVRKIRAVDDEHDRKRKLIMGELGDLQKKIEVKAKELDDNEKSYWETVIGEITRTITNMSKAPRVVVPPQDDEVADDE